MEGEREGEGWRMPKEGEQDDGFSWVELGALLRGNPKGAMPYLQLK